MKTRRVLWLVAAVMMAAPLIFYARGDDRIVVDAGTVVRQELFRSTVTASGEIVAARYADIGSSVMGRVVDLLVSEGQRVRSGQLLARIDPVQAESEAARALASVEALEAEREAAADALRAARAEKLAADALAREAAQQLERSRRLWELGLLPAREHDAAQATAEAAAARQKGAEAGVQRATHVLESARRRVNEARARLRGARDVLAKTAIVSPLDGTVTRLRVRAGEMVVVGVQNQPGTTLMTISDLAAIDAEVKVAEASVPRVDVGQRALVTLEALPGRSFSGRVTEVGTSALPVAPSTGAAREFRTIIRLDEPDPELRPGLTVDAEIVTAELSNVATVPLQSVVLRRRAGDDRDRPGVFVIQGDRVTFVPVVPGVIGGLDIAVEGVEPGTPIVIGPYQVLRDLTDGARIRVARSNE